MVPDTALVFGASGSLGEAISARLETQGSQVWRASRRSNGQSGWLSTDAREWWEPLTGGALNRVVWAQGLNAAGSILDDGPEQLVPLLQANVVYIVDTLSSLLDSQCLRAGSRLVVVSSIWQETARPGKLAYSVSKSALGGLVRSLAADLGDAGISVNAVLPGPVDGPMTRSFLSSSAIGRLEQDTPIRRLVTADDVARACEWLSSPNSDGVNGQSLTVDGGWSAVRHV